VKIIASIFLFPLAFLLFQPLLNNYDNDTKKECSAMKCDKKKQTKTRSCDNCNPFMACLLCNYFTKAKDLVSIKITVSPVQRISATNDNRLASRSSDCWHPPESL
jgi:hypothetical protein